MLRWVLLFLLISLVAGILGFTGIAAASAHIAKIIFTIFLVLFLLGIILLLFGKWNFFALVIPAKNGKWFIEWDLNAYNRWFIFQISDGLIQIAIW